MIHKLEADSILLEFGERRILSDVYIKCETGKVTGLLGRNGCGKTSLMNIIYGIQTANCQSIRIDDSFVKHAFKRPDLLLYLPQFNFIPKEFTLKRVFSDFELDYKNFEQYFPDFKNKYQHSICRLSGGYRRLVEIYLVIKSPSHFSLLDEPFSNLSPLLIESIQNLIVSEKNKGFLITDHMYREVVEIANDIYVLSDGATSLLKQEDDLINLGYLK